MSLPFPNVPDVPGVPALPRNPITATFEGSVSGTLLSVSSIYSGNLSLGQTLTNAAGSIASGTLLIGNGTGAGGIGTYALNLAQNALSGVFNTISSIPSPSLLSQDDLSGLVNTSKPVWGVYDDQNNLAVTADTISSLEYKQDWQISNYPVEDGAFQTYNKVQLPFEIPISFVSGGSESNRRDLLNSVKAIAGNFSLYSVVTPEQTYTNVNVSHFDYRRTAKQGVGMIEVTVYFIQINDSATFQMSSTNTDTTSGGSDVLVSNTATSLNTPGPTNASELANTTNLATSFNPFSPSSADPKNVGVVQSFVPSTAGSIPGFSIPDFSLKDLQLQ